jgi:hypothetical protein
VDYNPVEALVDKFLDTALRADATATRGQAERSLLISPPSRRALDIACEVFSFNGKRSLEHRMNTESVRVFAPATVPNVARGFDIPFPRGRCRDTVTVEKTSPPGGASSVRPLADVDGISADLPGIPQKHATYPLCAGYDLGLPFGFRVFVGRIPHFQRQWAARRPAPWGLDRATHSRTAAPRERLLKYAPLGEELARDLPTG